jgi:hypothetical protein
MYITGIRRYEMNSNIGTNAVPDRRRLCPRRFLGSVGNSILRYLPPTGLSAGGGGGAPPSIMSLYITGGCNVLNRNDAISRVISQEVKCSFLLWGCLLHSRFLFQLLLHPENVGNIFHRNDGWLTGIHGDIQEQSNLHVNLCSSLEWVSIFHIQVVGD